MSTTSLHQDPQVIKVSTWALLAFMGGAAKFVATTLASKEKLTFRRFMVLICGNVFVSGFGGIMGALIFSTISQDPTMQAIAAGVFGYLGTQGLETITTIYKKKIEIPT